GGDVKIAQLVQGQCPDVLGAGSKKNRGGVVRINRNGCLRLRGGFFSLISRCDTLPALHPVHLAIGRGAHINRVARSYDQRLYLELLRSKNHARLTLGGDAIHARWGAGGYVNVALAVGVHSPGVGGRSNVKRTE